MLLLVLLHLVVRVMNDVRLPPPPITRPSLPHHSIVIIYFILLKIYNRIKQKIQYVTRLSRRVRLTWILSTTVRNRTTKNTRDTLHENMHNVGIRIQSIKYTLRLKAVVHRMQLQISQQF